MPTTVTETGPFERLVTFQLSDDQITAGKAATARKLSQDMKLKGFRPGKAPLPVIEAAVGTDRLRSEVIDDLVPPALSEILTEEELRPAVTPQLESLNDVDGGVEVEIKVTLWPEHRATQLSRPECGGRLTGGDARGARDADRTHARTVRDGRGSQPPGHAR